ncbi:MAG: hypothetical protein HQM09_11635 [Candidatus Riflebacteria bacterium]|nr:hypothetical protein [Candidatus Riflebacteria bacterium]
MQDQASSLRQLKKLFDRQAVEPLPSPDFFLASIPRPTPFTSILIIAPDKVGSRFSPLQQWLPGFLRSGRSPTIWDQAGLLSARMAALEERDGDPSLPSRHLVEWSSGPVWLIPRIETFSDLVRQADAIRIRFSKVLNGLLSNMTSLWVTLSQNELSSCASLMHAVDIAIILVPQESESILRSYETVKTLHIAGFFAPILLLPESSLEDPTGMIMFDRIRNVAKQFLALDLLSGGVLPSDNPSPDVETVARLHGIIDSIESYSRRFLYSFAERLLYPSPKDGVEKHV